MRRRVVPIVAGFMLLCGTLAPAQDVPSGIPSEASRSAASLTKAAKTYHDGSLRDLDAIGNRKVGCDRGLGNWYSLEKQIEMGRGYSAQVESTTKLITDPVIAE